MPDSEDWRGLRARPHARLRGEALPASAALFGSLLFVIALSGLIRIGGSIPPTSRMFGAEYPQVVGAPLAQAQQQAREHQLDLVVLGERPSERYARGRIVQQSPIAGWQFGADGVLRVTVSQGMVAPDVRGQSYSAALAKLASLGWRIGKVESSAVGNRDWLQVTMQHPPPGAEVTEPGEITLVLSE